MEINYGIYIIAFICTIWILGVGCLLLDCLIKPKPMCVKVYKRSLYNNRPTDKEPDDSYVVMDEESDISNYPFNMSSSIFDSTDDITDSLT